jgi:hypothetical protein
MSHSLPRLALALGLALPVLAPAGVAAAPPQEEAAAQEPEAKPEKKAFARLKSPDKKKLQAALRKIEKGDEEEGEVEAGVAEVLALGEAAVPTLLASVPRMEKVERLAPLWTCLDGLLLETDLHLAWELRKKKSPLPLDRYLVRRWSDSKREDAQAFLEEQAAALGKVEDETRLATIGYETARGLVRRGDASRLDAIDAVIQSDWLERAAELRRDFAGVDRGPLAEAAAGYLKRRPRKEKIAGLHMFELFGDAAQAKLVRSFLSESDTTIRLAAIDACRLVVDGEPPLEKPSMTEIIERAEAWKARL